MIVNNFTNINKTKYHISSQLIEYKNSPRHMTLNILVLAWDRHTNVAELNRLMRCQPFPLDSWIFNGFTYINKQ